MGRASAPMYSASGHLLFLRDDAIIAAPFDARTAEVTGDAVTVIPAGVVRQSGSLPLIALAANGTLVYAPAQTGLVNLVRVSQDGATATPVGDATAVRTTPRVARWHARGAGAGRRLVVAARPVARRPHPADTRTIAGRQFPDLVA